MKTIMFLLTTILTINLHAQVQIDSITWGALDQHETAIAVSPINPKYVIATWNDFRTNIKSKPGYAVSSDGGYTWFKKDTLPPVNPDYRFGFDPSCGFDRYGNMYYCYSTYRNEPQNNYPVGPVYISKSANYGTSWQHILVSENYMYNQDKPYMAVDNTGGPYDGRVYVVWKDPSDGVYKLYFAYIPKGGTTIGRIDSMSNGTGAHIPVVSSNGDIFIVRMHRFGSSMGYHYIHQSTNGGQSFINKGSVSFNPFASNGLLLDDLYRIKNLPSYDIDPNNGYQYLAFADYVNYGSSDAVSSTLAIRISSDGGDNWLPTSRNPINNIDPASSDTIFFPWLSVDPSGKLGISFLRINRSRNKPLSLYYAESYDYGETFEAPYLKDGQWGLIDNPGSTLNSAQTYPNDYIGLTALIGKSYLTYWKHLASPKNTDIYRAIIKPKYITSNTVTATAYGSSPKIVYNNSRWHHVFMSNHKLYYTYSTDDGVTWDGFDMISGATNVMDIGNPSLSAYGDTLHVIFGADERKIYYTRKISGGAWSAPVMIYAAPQELYGLTSFVDNLRKGQTAFIEDNGMLLSNPLFRHGSFSVFVSNPALGGLTQIHSGYGMSAPAMDCDHACMPHVVWKQGNELYYKYKTGSSTWSSAFNLTDQSSYTPEYPVIDMIANAPHVAWQENINGNSEIIYRYKGANWYNPSNISNNVAFSQHPSLISTGNGPMIVWADKTSQTNYIKYHLPDLNETDNIAVFDYRYPHYPVVGLRYLKIGGFRVVAKWTTEQYNGIDQIMPFQINNGQIEMGIVPFFGKEHISSGALPKDHILYPNYPNPFNPNTQITFGVPDDSRVGIKIYDILGREVKFLTDREYKAGYHSVHWNGLDNKGNRVSSGVYIYRMMTKDKSICKKMLLVK